MEGLQEECDHREVNKKGNGARERWGAWEGWWGNQSEKLEEGGQSERRGDHTERKVREQGRGRRKIIFKNFHFNFFFNERKSDQSDCRIFHDLPIFCQISYFEFSRFVIGQFRSRDRYPSSWLVEFASLNVNKENQRFTLFHQISLRIYYYFSHVTCVLQPDWLDLVLPM